MERILLSNIATILIKDTLIDDNKPKYAYNSFSNEFPLLASDTDDEALHFFFKQRNASKRKQTEEHKKSYIPKFKKCTNNVVDTNTPNPSDLPPNNVVEPCEPTRRQSIVEINLLNKFNATVFEGYLHMSKLTFLGIFKRIRIYLPNKHIPTSAPPQSIFSLALWKLSTDEHFEDIGRKFNITKYVCQQVIRLFWRRVSGQYDSFIQWPSTPQKRHNAITNFRAHQQLNKFRMLFGIVAIKHLDVFLESDNEERQVVIQIICDADQKVMDCFLVLAEEYSFDASPIGQTLALNVQTMPLGSYLIGDESFPLKPYLLRPIGEPISDNERAFNVALQPALNIVQQVLDSMAKRFNVLYALEARNLHEVRKIVDTVCALHNLCIEMEDDYVERKLKGVQFNWAKESLCRKRKIGSEDDKLGQQKRAELMEDI